MAGAATGNGAQCGVGFAADGLDALAGPQQKRQLSKTHFFLRINAGAAAALNQLRQVCSIGS